MAAPRRRAEDRARGRCRERRLGARASATSRTATSNQTASSSAASGAQWGDYEGAQYGQRRCTANAPANQAPCQDTDIRNFRFNQDYRIDLILWREIIGGITDALYIKSGTSYAFNDSLSVFGALIYSKALKPTSTPSGTSTQLGFEVNAGVRYQTDDGFYAQLAYGILFPFDGLQYNYNSPYIALPNLPRGRAGDSCPARDPLLGARRSRRWS